MKNSECTCTCESCKNGECANCTYESCNCTNCTC